MTRNAIEKPITTCPTHGVAFVIDNSAEKLPMHVKADNSAGLIARD